MINFLFGFFFFAKPAGLILLKGWRDHGHLETPFTGSLVAHHPPLIALSYKEQAVITRKECYFY